MSKTLLFTFLPFWVYYSTAAQERPLTSKMDKDIDRKVQQYLKWQKPVGLVIGVVKDGKVFYYSYGETSRGNGQLPDEHTIFEIGSITKTFTATLLAKAVVEGKVKLDDPVSKYLPDSLPALAFRGVPATLVTLANHTSGLPGNPSNITYPPEIGQIWSGDPFKDYDDKDLFSFYAHFALRRMPGRKNDYSNLGFGTLGVILERVYGRPFERLVLEEIAGPLGMVDTRQTVRPADTPRVAQGYAVNGKPAPAWHDKAMAGCGALRSTAYDLLRYAWAEIGEADVDAGMRGTEIGGVGDTSESLKAAIGLLHQITYRQKKGGIGLAWNIERHDTTEWIWHGGVTGGYGSFLVFSPNRKIALVILANHPVGVDNLAGDVLEIIGE